MADGAGYDDEDVISLRISSWHEAQRLYFPISEHYAQNHFITRCRNSRSISPWRSVYIICFYSEKHRFNFLQSYLNSHLKFNRLEAIDPKYISCGVDFFAFPNLSFVCYYVCYCRTRSTSLFMIEDWNNNKFQASLVNS